jgi:UDP-glucose 4-epimerase
MLSLTNKRILVTGGAGFVGSNLVKTLVEKCGARVRVIDDLFTGTLDNLKETEFEFIHGTIEDELLVDKAVKGMDVVFHLASRNIILSNKNPRDDLNVNVRGSFNVFEACKKHRVARVVYTSTSSVYGEPETVPVNEGDKKSFLNFYSASKYSAEVYANTFYEVFQLPVTILRYSNVYGPNQLPVNPYCGVIGKFIAAALAGEPLKIYGSGRQTRDYTYVDDAVNATIAAALRPEAVGEDYNIGTGCETSVNELSQSILQITKSNSVIEHVNNRDIDNISRRSININKAITDLHFKPQYSITEGLKKTVNWFRASVESASLSLVMSSAVFIY